MDNPQPSDNSVPKPSALYTNRRILFVLLVLVLLPVVVFAALNPTIFSPKASTGLPIASVKISPGEIITKPLGSEIHLSTLAYDTGGNPITSGVTYQWGMSSTNSIGTIIQEQGNGALGTFTPSANAGHGDLWVRAFAGESQGMGSIPVSVGTTPPTPTPMQTPTPISSPSPTPTPNPTSIFGNAAQFTSIQSPPYSLCLKTTSVNNLLFTYPTDLRAFTIEGWVMPYRQAGTPGYGIEEFLIASENMGYLLPIKISLIDNKLSFTSILYKSNQGLFSASFTSPEILTRNQWYHFAIVSDSSVAKMFLDGKLQSSIPYISNSNISGTTANTPLIIGCQYNTISGQKTLLNNFSGELDDILISNQARYSTSFTPIRLPYQLDVNTLALWHMDSPYASSTTPDASASHNDLSVIGVNYFYFVPSTILLPPTTPTPTPTPGPFTSLSATMPKPGSAMFSFSYTGTSNTFIVDASTVSNMSTDVYHSFASGPSSPIVETNPTKWDKYSCGRTLYWRVLTPEGEKSAIQTSLVTCTTPTLTPTPQPTATPTLIPTPTPTPTPISCNIADINRDGVVDYSDYTILASDFFKTTPSTIRSDINRDGVIDIIDYSLYVYNLLNTLPTGACQ